jgi:streptomycin 6-kinase
MQPYISDTYAQFVLKLHGDKGKAWLARLPAILARCATRWQLSYDAPFGNHSYHYTIPATRADGLAVVVKVCAPTGEYALEAEALRLFDGQGMVRLLASDDAEEVLLLERAVPGTSLRQMTDDAGATRIAADVMRRFWRPVPTSPQFPTVADWRKGLDRLHARYGGATGPFPDDLVELAEEYYAHLSATAAPSVLLHGDLHHDNILAAQRETWLGIDPKGLIGEPAYETGAWLRNWLPDLLLAPDPAAILARRIAIFAEELQLDPERIRGWAVYQAVDSAWWTMEDSDELDTSALACAQLLADLAL